MNEILFRKIERLKEETFYLERNRTRFLKDLQNVDTKKIVERSVYLCAEIVLDIADSIIAMIGLPKASTYSDSIYKLSDYKVIPKDFAHKFVYIAGLRNFLAHDYQIETTKDLKKFLRYGINDTKRFITLIEKL